MEKQPDPVEHHAALGRTATLAVALALLVTIFAAPYSTTFQARWDCVWRDHFMKQASGYAQLAMGVLLASIGVRKRMPLLAVCGSYGGWRLAHTILGTVSVVGIVLHSGGRMGQGLTFGLSFSWLGSLLTGSCLALVAARFHELPARIRELTRQIFYSLHIGLLWSVPVLLTGHITGTYLWH